MLLINLQKVIFVANLLEYCAHKKSVIALKGVHPIMFVLNIFPNLHLIQKCIYNQQLFWNSMYTFLNQMRIGKNIRHKDDRMKSL